MGFRRLPRPGGSQLGQNIASGAVSSVLGAFMLAVSYPLYLEFLGRERYGTWLALTTVLGFSQFGSFGIGPALTKLVAEEHGNESQTGVRGYLACALSILAFAGVIVAALTHFLGADLLALFRIPASETEAAHRVLPYIALLSGYGLVTEALTAAVAGLGRADISNWLQLVSQLSMLLTSAALLWLGFGMHALLSGLWLCFVILHAGAWLTIRRVGGFGFVSQKDLSRERIVRLLRFSGWVFGSSVINLLLGPLNKMVLSQHAGVGLLPLYELAFNGSMRIRNLFETGLRALVPEISRLSTKPGGNARIRELKNKSLIRLSVAGGLLFGALIASAPIWLQVWLGSQFDPALTPAMRILLAATFCSLLAVPPFYTLAGIGQVRSNFIGSIVLAGTNAAFIGTAVSHGMVTLTAVCAGVFAGMASLAVFVNWRATRALADPIPGLHRFQGEPTTHEPARLS